MGETLYPLHPVRSHEQDQNLTPYSAVCYFEFFPPSSYTTQILSDSPPQVSSFNLPHSCDSSLITPVSMTPSSLTVSTTPVLGSDMDIKLSPSNSMSPTYDVFELEEEYGMPKYNPPMKYKHPHGTLHISTTDANFPHSPLVPSTPYWGAYGVSATPVSTTPESPPTMIRSPIGPVLHSTGHLGYDGDQGRLQATSQSYRNRTTVPLLIAPHPRVQSPTSMAESIPTSSTPYRQNSLQSVSTTSSNASAISSRARSKSRIATIPIRRRRKSPKHAQGGEILLSGDMSNDDRVLIQLSEGQRLPWKEIVRQFHERTGKNLKPAALQMRKKRLMDKLRVWTPSDVFAISFQISLLNGSKQLLMSNRKGLFVWPIAQNKAKIDGI